MKGWAILAALLGTCCGSSEPAPSCVFALAPEPGLADSTRAVAERWSAATGCAIHLDDGGVPVVYVSGLKTNSGKRAAGAWRHVEGSDECARIDIDVDLGGPRTLAHEVGHCLGARGHAPTGLMAEGAPGLIDEASLELVCSKLACTSFVPEVQR